MCSRSNKAAVQTAVILVLIVCIAYGFYLYTLLQVRVKYLDNKALRHQSQEKSLTSQLQAVYEDRARLEKSVQKSRSELQQIKEEKESMVQSMLLEYQEKSQALDKQFQELKDKNKELIDESTSFKVKHDRILKQHDELKQKHEKALAAHSSKIKEVNDELQKYEYRLEALGRHQEELESQLSEAKGKFESLQELFKLVPVSVINFEHPGIEALDEDVRELLMDRLKEENDKADRGGHPASDHEHVVTAHVESFENKEPVKAYDHDSVNAEKEEELHKPQAQSDLNNPLDQPGGNINGQLDDTVGQSEGKGSRYKDKEWGITGKDVKQTGNEEDDFEKLRENSKLQLELAQNQQADMEKIMHQQRQSDQQLEQPKERHIRLDIKEDDGVNEEKYENADEEEENVDDNDEGGNDDVDVDEENTYDEDDRGPFEIDSNLNEERDAAQVAVPPPLHAGNDAEAVINPPAAEQDGIDSEEINGQHLYREQEDGAYEDDNLQEEGDAGVDENEGDVEGNFNQADNAIGEEDKVDDIGRDDDYGNEEEDEREKNMREYRNRRRVMNDKNFLVRNEVQDMIPREANMEKEM